MNFSNDINETNTTTQSNCSKGNAIMDQKIKQNGAQKFVMSLPVLKISPIQNQAKN